MLGAAVLEADDDADALLLGGHPIVWLAVGTHPGKTPLFSVEERLDMLSEACKPIAREAGCKIGTITFADLVVSAAQRESE